MDNITPVYLDKINPSTIARECSSAHTENVIKDLVELLSVARALAEEVSTLNPTSGELGEGKCLNTHGKAAILLKYLR